MAVQIQRAGKTTVKITPASGSIATLGICEDQADIVDKAYHLDVPGDTHGGPAGPPIDIQFMGRTANIRVRMSSWDTTVAKQVEARKKSGSALAVAAGDIGDLMIQDAEYIGVSLSSANIPRTYPICVLRDMFEFGEGTKYATLICEFEAHRDPTSGVLFRESGS